MQRMVLWLLVLTATLVISIPAAAQDNLLRDGGFEGSYTNRGRADLNIPADWNLWFTEAPRTESWMNLPPVAFPHNGPGPDPHSGARALNINKGFATFTAAVYQQVGVPSGTNVTASAWASLKTCNVPPGFDNCGSAVESGAYTRVGIDPNGGTNPYDSDVVWSASATPHDRWDQMTVSATTTGTTATVFLFVTQAWPADINSVYWDDAVLSTGGAGGAAAPAGTPAPGEPTAAPPPPAEVGFVQQQEAGDDGSLIHRVQPGDTIDSIAVAYGMTRAELLAVNPDIRDPRIIQIGQEIVIIPPEGGATAEADAESTGEAEGSAESTGEAETTPDAESTGEAGESTDEPPRAAIEDAPPAPIISVASGEVLPSIDLAANDAEVCVLLFEDSNNNRIQESGEGTLAGGIISLTGEGGAAQEQETDGGADPLCFSDLSAGEYIAAVQPPTDYGMTTPDHLRVRAVSGTTVNVAFGAAQGFQPVTPPPADTLVSETVAEEGEPATTNADPLADNLGLVVFGIAGVVLVVGLGLSLFLRQR